MQRQSIANIKARLLHYITLPYISVKKHSDKLDTHPHARTQAQLHYACEDLSAYLCVEFSVAFSAAFQNKSGLVTDTFHIPLRWFLLPRTRELHYKVSTAERGLWARPPRLLSLPLTYSGTPTIQDLSNHHKALYIKNP